MFHYATDTALFLETRNFYPIDSLNHHLVLCFPTSCNSTMIDNKLISVFPVPQAPPVGLYDVLHEKQGPGAGFGKGKRFADLKGEKNVDKIQ